MKLWKEKEGIALSPTDLLNQSKMKTNQDIMEEIKLWQQSFQAYEDSENLKK